MCNHQAKTGPAIPAPAIKTLSGSENIGVLVDIEDLKRSPQGLTLVLEVTWYMGLVEVLVIQRLGIMQSRTTEQGNGCSLT